jgi:hypothetical protein
MDLRQEEKIIGGYMSLRQIGYLLAGFTIGAILAYLLNWLPIIFLPVAFGGFLGFGNIRGESGDRWIALVLNKREREYYYHRQRLEEAEPDVAPKTQKKTKRQ